MKIDVTLNMNPDMVKKDQQTGKAELTGHLGTHFDVMNKVFPLDYTCRAAVVFDVSSVGEREISLEDVDISRVEPDMFVAFYTGFIEAAGYGTCRYQKEHPQLTQALIKALVERGVSIIGIDFAGVRRGKEHTPMDQYCADNGVFVVENLCNLKAVLACTDTPVMHTYPMSFSGVSGLPCRVMAEV